MPSWWSSRAKQNTRVFRQLRAFLVAFHIVAIVVAAVPGPDGGMSRSTWRDPSVQSELAAWAKRFGTTPTRLEDWVWPIADALFRARQAARRPVVPYLDLTGTDQPWRIFIAPDRVPARFQLQARPATDSSWQTLYEERSSTYRWNAGYFDDSRVRRALYWYGWPPRGGDAGRHCRWVAARVLRERRDFGEVRCRFFRAPSLSAADVRNGAEALGEWVQETVVHRAEAGLP